MQGSLRSLLIIAQLKRHACGSRDGFPIDTGRKLLFDLADKSQKAVGVTRRSGSGGIGELVFGSGKRVVDEVDHNGTVCSIGGHAVEFEGVGVGIGGGGDGSWVVEDASIAIRNIRKGFHN